MDAEMAVKIVATGGICHMGHAVHAGGHGFPVIGDPDGPPVPTPGTACNALHNGGIASRNGFHIRMIPAAKPPGPETKPGAYVRNGELSAFMEPFFPAFKPIQQDHAAFKLCKGGGLLFRSLLLS